MLSTAQLGRFASRWRPDDPGLASLRRALRVALILPPAFALALFVVRDVNATIYVGFGTFSLLVLADFGGMRGPRAGAYVGTVLVGAVLIAIGTLVSPVPWVAALAMFVVAFLVQLLGVFGSYAAAAQPALQLLFVLTVTIPAPPSAVGSRLFGWAIAGTICTLAGVFLWPRFERVRLRKSAAVALEALAGLVETLRGNRPEEVTAARERALQAVGKLRADYSRTAKRPAGPARRDRAFIEMVTELERTLEFLDRPFGLQNAMISRNRAESGKLASAVVLTLRASAAVMKDGEPPDLLSLEDARAADREELDSWAAEALRQGRPPAAVFDALVANHALRIVSYLALALGTNATLVAGRTPEAELRLPAGTPLQGPSRIPLRIGRTLRTHLNPDSAVLHNALRSATGLALAVLVARLLRLDHAFWVVLGTASVLRTNALATGRTTLEALLGTLLGFAVGAAFTSVAATNTILLWIAFPIAAFLASYATTAVGFVVGQAAFTINVLILFNLITPVGWRLGLARIEDIVIGTGISVVVGLLLWPRGARREFSRSLADFYRATATFAATAFARVLEHRTLQESMRARTLAVLARDRAGEALDQFLNERAAKRVSPETAASLLASAGHVLLVGDLLNRFADAGYSGDHCSQGVKAVEVQIDHAVGALKRVGDRLEGGRADGDLAPAPGSYASLRDAALVCLTRWRDDPQIGRSAITLVVAVEWTEALAELAAELERPASELASAARVPWWR